MRRSYLALFIATTMTLSACGTQDYGQAPAGVAAPGETKHASPALEHPASIPLGTAPCGYLWHGLKAMGLPDLAIQRARCTLQDGPFVNYWQTFGGTILGGAVLGIVIRSSGSNFLGEPASPDSGHWFWMGLDQTMSRIFKGAGLGGAFAYVCDTLLAGGNMLPITGILGHDFVAFSSAATLGAMSSIAAAPPIGKFMREGSRPKASDKPFGDRSWRENLAALSHSSTTGKVIRYRLAPALTILFVGAGVGVLVYDKLTESPDQTEDHTTCTP